MTPFGTSRILAIGLTVVALHTPSPVAASVVLVPIVTRVHGQNDALWTTEVRVTNRTDDTAQFRVVDWIGTPGWRPATYSVAPHSTKSLGGADVFGGFVAGPGVAGLAILEADDGLLIQAAILLGIWGGGGATDFCPSYDGGGGPSCGGFIGAGPIVEDLAFADPGETVYVPWLHTEEHRRTNLVLVNPDDAPAHVTVTLRSQDGLASTPEAYDLPPRSYNQANDIFSRQPWSSIRASNTELPLGAAASATIVSDRRLLALAFVISSVNNSLTVSVPR